MNTAVCSFLVLVFTTGTESLDERRSTPDGSEEWGYVPVRPGASMFYWFYKTTHPDGHLNRPIVLWLQGGPGLSGTGLGNFLMFGPLDQNLQPRNSTWIQSVNVLFVDNPVAAGYSVADSDDAIPNNVEKISEDLITLLKVFIEEHAGFSANPFYIFGQSYGGKMAGALVYYLHQAIQAGEIQCNLKGAAIGNGWVSGTDIMSSWVPMLYQISLIDDVQYANLSCVACEAWEAGEKENWEGVKKGWDTLFKSLEIFLPFLNFYNVVDLYWTKEHSNATNPSEPPHSIYDVNLTVFMDGLIKEKLGIIPQSKIWGTGKQATKRAQFTNYDLLKPVWHLVDEVLKNSSIDIIIYQGQLDIICDTSGVLRWMQRLTWPGKKKFDQAERKVLTTPGSKTVEMFVKSYENLKMYWVLNSGHAVPADVPDVALRMLNRIIDGVD